MTRGPRHAAILATLFSAACAGAVHDDDDDGSLGELQAESAASDPLVACARNVAVTSSGALAKALDGAKAGDCIVLADGQYTFPTVDAQGTATNPIVVRAANPLK